jgi:hypothetical protein
MWMVPVALMEDVADLVSANAGVSAGVLLVCVLSMYGASGRRRLRHRQRREVANT